MCNHKPANLVLDGLLLLYFRFFGGISRYLQYFFDLINIDTRGMIITLRILMRTNMERRHKCEARYQKFPEFFRTENLLWMQLLNYVDIFI